MARQYFHVTPSSTGGWDFKQQNSTNIIKHEPTKQALLSFAQQYCQSRQPSELVIHNEDGQISNRSTYGNDPFPPRG